MESAPSSPLIQLHDGLLIGRRQTRATYRHPDKQGLVLKVAFQSAPGRKRWYERPPNIQISLERELSGYADLLSRLGRHPSFIGRIYGLENTTLGPAILAENVTVGTTDHCVLRDFLKSRTTFTATLDEVRRIESRYREIGGYLTEKGVYTHGIRPENFMIVRRNNALELRMFDFKTNVYRQLISPRFVPGAERYEQRRKIREVMHLFEIWFRTHA